MELSIWKKILIIAVLVIIFIALAILRGKPKVSQVPVVGNNSNSKNNSVSSSPASTTPLAEPTAVKSAPKLSYTQAVETYKDRRIQFDPDCRAIPSYMTLKNPATIMLDNRSNVARKITINGRTYAIGAYGFTVVTVNSKTLPTVLPVKCDAQYNVGRILIQK